MAVCTCPSDVEIIELMLLLGFADNPHYRGVNYVSNHINPMNLTGLVVIFTTIDFFCQRKLWHITTITNR